MKWLIVSCAAMFWLCGLPAFAKPALVVKVDLSDQVMRVYVEGTEFYMWKVSTGKRGYGTPVGRYSPGVMHRMHYSSKYENAPMPHSIFFHGGYAVHGTDALRSLGKPVSHGCVRLHPDNARELFQMVRYFGKSNSRIVIAR